MSVKAWNDEQEAELIKLYTEEDRKDVHELANHFSKGYRSVISKLVQLKILCENYYNTLGHHTSELIYLKN